MLCASARRAMIVSHCRESGRDLKGTHVLRQTALFIIVHPPPQVTDRVSRWRLTRTALTHSFARTSSPHDAAFACC